MKVAIVKDFADLLFVKNHASLDVMIDDAYGVWNGATSNIWRAEIAINPADCADGETFELSWGVPATVLTFTLKNTPSPDNVLELPAIGGFGGTPIEYMEALTNALLQHPLVREQYDVTGKGYFTLTTLSFESRLEGADNTEITFGGTLPVTVDFSEGGVANEGKANLKVKCRLWMETFMNSNIFEIVDTFATSAIVKGDSNTLHVSFADIPATLKSKLHYDLPQSYSHAWFAENQSKHFYTEVWVEWQDGTDTLYSKITKSKTALAILAGFDLEHIDAAIGLNESQLFDLLLKEERVLRADTTEWINLWKYEANDYFQADLVVNYSDGSTITTSISYHELEDRWGKGLYRIPANYLFSNYVTPPADTVCSSIDFSIRVDGSLVKSIRYIIDNRYFPFSQQFLYFDSLGALQVIYFTGEQLSKVKLTTTAFDKVVDNDRSAADGITDVSYLSHEQVYKINTGLMDADKMQELKSFLISNEKYQFLATQITDYEASTSYEWKVAKIVLKKDGFDLVKSFDFMQFEDIEYAFAWSEELHTLLTAPFKAVHPDVAEFDINGEFTLPLEVDKAAGNPELFIDDVGQGVSFSSSSLSITKGTNIKQKGLGLGILFISGDMLFHDTKIYIRKLPNGLLYLEINGNDLNIDYLLKNLRCMRVLNGLTVRGINAVQMDMLLVECLYLYKLYGKISTIDLYLYNPAPGTAGANAKSILTSFGVSVNTH